MNTSANPKQKVFYKMLMGVCEEGLSVSTRRYYSIHETPRFHFCLAERDCGFVGPAFKRDGETDLQAAKRKGIKVHRIAKAGSRVAFETEDQAFLHLRFLKRKQLTHMKRDLQFVSHFLEATEDKAHRELERGPFENRVVPDTQELVHEHYLFD